MMPGSTALSELDRGTEGTSRRDSAAAPCLASAGGSEGASNVFRTVPGAGTGWNGVERMATERQRQGEESGKQAKPDPAVCRARCRRRCPVRAPAAVAGGGPGIVQQADARQQGTCQPAGKY